MLTQASRSTIRCTRALATSWTGPNRTTHTFLRSSAKYRSSYRWFKITTFRWEMTQKRTSKSDKWSVFARTTSGKWTLQKWRKLLQPWPQEASPFSRKDRTKLTKDRPIPSLSQTCRIWYSKSTLCLRQGTAQMPQITRLHRNKTLAIHLS